MGQSTDGQLCFGLCLAEDIEFPWTDEEGNEDLDQWSLDVNQYRPPIEIYDSRGDYLNGEVPTDADVEAYWNHRKEWLATHPLPFELVNYCSHEWPMYIMAIPGTLTTANRGCPQLVNADLLSHDMTPIVDLCAKYSIEHDSKIGWFLSSYAETNQD